jgi:Family of unknown function (DUF6496)
MEEGGSAMAKYAKKASKKVARAMRERKRGTLKSGRSGKTVKSRKQAIAIGLSEARRAGAKVPAKKGGAKKSSAKKSSAKKSSSARKSSAKKTSAKKSNAKKSSTKRSSSKRSGKRSSRKTSR